MLYAGAHTLGRAKPDRSGFGKESTKYTKDGPGKPGGSSWTPEWLKFDNSYFKVSPPPPPATTNVPCQQELDHRQCQFPHPYDLTSAMQEVKEQHDPELLVLETDNVLFKDEGFR